MSRVIILLQLPKGFPLPSEDHGALWQERQTLSDSRKIITEKGYNHKKCAQEVMAEFNMFWDEW